MNLSVELSGYYIHLAEFLKTYLKTGQNIRTETYLAMGWKGTSMSIVSLRNRTVERRGRQNAWAWQTWRDYYLRVLSRIHLKLMFLTLLQKDLFKGMWSLAEAKQKQNYCHACHTRFAVVFPLPSCCVSSLIPSGEGCCKSVVPSVSLALGESMQWSCLPLVCHVKFL